MNDSPPQQSDQGTQGPAKDKAAAQKIESKHRDDADRSAAAKKESAAQKDAVAQKEAATKTDQQKSDGADAANAKDAQRETRAGGERKHEQQSETRESDKAAASRHMKIETRHEKPGERKAGSAEGRGRDAAGQAQDRSGRSDRLTPEQRAERAQITERPNLVGFASGVDDPARNQVQRVLDNIPASIRNSPDATIFLTGRASRTGGVEFNQLLSERRVDNVEMMMKELGVKAHIETFAYGEQDARDVGQPDNFDDKDFRSVRVDVTPPTDKGNTPKFEVDWTKDVPDFSKVDTEKEGLDRLKSVAKPTWDVLKHVATDDYKGLAKDVAKAVRAAGEKGAENQEHKIRREHINTNLVPGYLNAFERYMLGRVDSARPAVESSPWLYPDHEKRTRARQEANAGKYLFEQELQNKSPEEIESTRKYVQNPDNLRQFQSNIRKAFNRKLNW